MNYLELEFSDDEKNLISLLVEEKTIDWAGDHFAVVRAKIRKFFRELQGDKCCYCRKSFALDHSLAIDIEHILPKSAFIELAAEPVNLAVACKRCNMSVKNANYSFIFNMDRDAILAKHAESSSYEIVHPNLDVYSDHIHKILIQIDGSMLRHYQPLNGSSKAMRTIEFFRLRDLEINDLDVAQGIKLNLGDGRSLLIQQTLGL